MGRCVPPCTLSHLPRLARSGAGRLHRPEDADAARAGGDRPSDVLAQAKVRKEQGFTRVKMNVRARAPGLCLSHVRMCAHGWFRLPSRWVLPYGAGML